MNFHILHKTNNLPHKALRVIFGVEEVPQSKLFRSFNSVNVSASRIKHRNICGLNLYQPYKLDLRDF